MSQRNKAHGRRRLPWLPGLPRLPRTTAQDRPASFLLLEGFCQWDRFDWIAEAGQRVDYTALDPDQGISQQLSPPAPGRVDPRQVDQCSLDSVDPHHLVGIN